MKHYKRSGSEGDTSNIPCRWLTILLFERYEVVGVTWKSLRIKHRFWAKAAVLKNFIVWVPPYSIQYCFGSNDSWFLNQHSRSTNEKKMILKYRKRNDKKAYS